MDGRVLCNGESKLLTGDLYRFGLDSEILKSFQDNAKSKCGKSCQVGVAKGAVELSQKSMRRSIWYGVLVGSVVCGPDSACYSRYVVSEWSAGLVAC